MGIPAPARRTGPGPAEAVRARAERDELRNRVLLETKEAFLDLETTAQQAVLFEDRILPGAERAFEVAGRSYDEGKLTYLELLEARRTWIETRVDYAHALFEYGAAAAALERAVAGSLAPSPQGE